MSKNVFVDLHQDDLYYSLHLLFEKRLGWKLFRPLGMDWYKNGFWKYSDNMPTVKQYLQPQGDEIKKNGYSLAYERRHNYFHKVLSFEQFKEFPIDIVIGSVVQHEQTYIDLIKKHKPKAKFIRQAGNIHDMIDTNICKNIMCSAKPVSSFPDINIVFYHQEFDLNTFSFVPVRRYNRITNLMNCFPDSPDAPLWYEFKQAIPDYDFKMYGILGDDGIIGETKNVAKAFHDTTFIWHLKHQGDGFGHVIHNAFATGRPPIVIAKYYNNTMAGDLMEGGKTCIFLDNKKIGDCVKEIEFYAQPDKYYSMSNLAYNKFKENVNFDYEFTDIVKFLGNLV